MSHISDILEHPRPSVTTLRSACVALIALRACRLSEALGLKILCQKPQNSQNIDIILAARSQ